jgi:hypothetical protein
MIEKLLTKILTDPNNDLHLLIRPGFVKSVVCGLIKALEDSVVDSVSIMH